MDGSVRGKLPCTGWLKTNPRVTIDHVNSQASSKTFLARLCEQAERYDGKSVKKGIQADGRTADNTSTTRDGHVHEGE